MGEVFCLNIYMLYPANFAKINCVTYKMFKFFVDN
jgi:hypothetical protein